MFFISLVSVFAVSAVSLIGVLFLFFSEDKISRWGKYLVSFAVGALFGEVFFHIFPEIFSAEEARSASLLIMGSVLFFFAFEKFLHWRHEHEPGHVHPMGYTNIFADGLHNLIDGMFIATAYIVSFPLGFATTIAVIAHEIPQEIGDYSILVRAGFSRKKALFFNFLSAVAAFLGVLIIFIIGKGGAEHLVGFILPIAAGGFLYLAGSDLMPDLHREQKISNTFFELFFLTLGAALLFFLTFLE